MPNVIAIMVIYQPPDGLEQRIAAILPQVKKLIMVDNGKNAVLREQLGETVQWIDSPENNLAMAQNLGIEAALKSKADWVLLLDDDSKPEADFVQAMLIAHQKYLADKKPNVGVLGCYYEEQAISRVPHYYQSLLKIGFRKVHFRGPVLRRLWYVPASGSLLSRALLEEGLRMDETLGMYFVDTDFCLRARQAGYDVAAIRDARLAHRFGARSENALGISTTNHSAAARYKMFVNRKVMWWRHLKTEPGYVLFDTLRAVSEMLRILFFENDRDEKIRAINCALLGWKYEPL
jgi:GT2 family glycosyltransferase